MYAVMTSSRFFMLALCLAANARYSMEGASEHKDPHVAGGDRQSTIVHLFEWKFDDIAKECEFLSKYGYSGVQVSPVNENIIVENRPWFERYQPLTYKIVTRSGNEQQFTDMVVACNRLGIRIYVDAVVNHMAADHDEVRGTGGSTADPRSRSYPDAGYTAADFHPLCAINNYQNATEVRDCELAGLHDLDQYKANVRCRITNFLNKLIDIGVAGFRFDAAKHMWPEDLKYLYSQLNSLNATFFPTGSKPFIYQEVIDPGDEAIHSSEYTSFALVTDFMFSTNIGKVFRNKFQLRSLETWGPGDEWQLLNKSDALVFVDNHDNQRGHGSGGADILTHKDPQKYKMANAFMLAWPQGFPRIMSSYYFDGPSQGPPHDRSDNTLDVEINSDMTCRNGWTCEHRWRQIYNMVQFRNIVAGTEVREWWDNGNNQIAFCRGDKGFVAFNAEKFNLNTRLMTCLPAGYYCDIVSGTKEDGYCTGRMILVGFDGFANIYIGTNDEDLVLAIHEKSRLWNPIQNSRSTRRQPSSNYLQL